MPPRSGSGGGAGDGTGKIPGPVATREAEAERREPIAGAYGSDSIRSLKPGAAPRQRSGIGDVIYQAAPYMGAASVMTAAVLGGGFGGRWLDGKFGTSPLLLTIGLLGGAALGLYDVVRVATYRGSERR